MRVRVNNSDMKQQKRFEKIFEEHSEEKDLAWIEEKMLEELEHRKHFFSTFTCDVCF